MNKIKNLRKVFLTANFVGAAMLFSIFMLPGHLATVSSQDRFTVENNTDRPGGDYKDFDLSEAKYQLCQNACANDSSCQSYTYVRPGVQGSAARCWLKNTVPTAGGSSCCVSGVKKGGGAKGDFSGDWYAGEWGNITFNQNGNQVNGNYTRGNGSIYGTVSGNRLNATWQQDGRTGVVYFIVQSDGTLGGKYCEGKGCSPENGTSFSGRRR